MRLKKNEKEIILQSVHSLDPEAIIYLFGSRIDDSKKGGDIDILIISEKLNYGDKLIIKKNIFKFLEEQKIDIVISKGATTAFTRHALSEGIRIE